MSSSFQNYKPNFGNNHLNSNLMGSSSSHMFNNGFNYKQGHQPNNFTSFGNTKTNFSEYEVDIDIEKTTRDLIAIGSNKEKYDSYVKKLNKSVLGDDEMEFYPPGDKSRKFGQQSSSLFPKTAEFGGKAHSLNNLNKVSFGGQEKPFDSNLRNSNMNYGFNQNDVRSVTPTRSPTAANQFSFGNAMYSSSPRKNPQGNSILGRMENQANSNIYVQYNSSQIENKARQPNNHNLFPRYIDVHANSKYYFPVDTSNLDNTNELLREPNQWNDRTNRNSIYANFGLMKNFSPLNHTTGGGGMKSSYQNTNSISDSPGILHANRMNLGISSTQYNFFGGR